MESMEVKAPSYFSKLDMKKEEEKELVVRLSAGGKLLDEPTRSQGRFNEFLFTMTTGHNLPDEYRTYLPPEEDQTPSDEDEIGLEEPPKQRQSRNGSDGLGSNAADAVNPIRRYFRRHSGVWPDVSSDEDSNETDTVEEEEDLNKEVPQTQNSFKHHRIKTALDI
jgi:hypothetical protein